jgi:hypothetical protein
LERRSRSKTVTAAVIGVIDVGVGGIVAATAMGTRPSAPSN